MLTAKFKVGQKVYAVSNTNDSRQKHVECDVCNSTGKVKVEGRDEEYVCPACHGRTETEHYGYMYVISYYEATIGKIEIEESVGRFAIGGGMAVRTFDGELKIETMERLLITKNLIS